MDDFDRNKVIIKRPKMVTEDRLSGLPDELLHQIFSCFDTKYVVQTCLLSPRWKIFWRSMPCLTLSSQEFDSLPQFSKFVTKVLHRRNHQIDVSSIKLIFYGAGSQAFVKRIARYASRHNIQQLIVSSIGLHASLRTPKTHWDIPVLTTLYLSNVTLRGKDAGDSIDLFSKCLNLKNLTLKSIRVWYEAAFDIVTPRLENLILVRFSHPNNVVNVIAPQLENLTVIDCSIKYLNAPPGIAYTKLCTMELLGLLKKQEDMQLTEACIWNLIMAMLSKALALEKKKMQSPDSNKSSSAQIVAELAPLTASIQACARRLHDVCQEKYKNFEAIYSKEIQIIRLLLKNLPTQDMTEYTCRLKITQTLHHRLLSTVEDSSCCNKKIIDVFKEHDVSHNISTFQDIARTTKLHTGLVQIMEARRLQHRSSHTWLQLALRPVSTTFMITEDWAKRFELMQSLIKKGILLISTLREDNASLSC